MMHLYVVAYFSKIKGHADTMASLGKPISEEEVLDSLLAGLGSEYKHPVASITTRDDPVSLTNFYAYFVSGELCLE